MCDRGHRYGSTESKIVTRWNEAANLLSGSILPECFQLYLLGTGKDFAFSFIWQRLEQQERGCFNNGEQSVSCTGL